VVLPQGCCLASESSSTGAKTVPDTGSWPALAMDVESAFAGKVRCSTNAPSACRLATKACSSPFIRQEPWAKRIKERMGSLQHSSYWRERAEEARKQSNRMRDPLAKETMLEIATSTKPWQSALLNESW
jgi:hypothetical protein